MKRQIISVQGRGKLLLVALCVSAGLAAFAVQALGSFGKARGFAVGSSPSSIAIGDINQDSRDDLAVPGSDYPKTVSVLLGRGRGTFGAATALSTGAGNFGSPTAVAIGNLNAGLNPDLAVTISSPGPGAGNRVAVLLNTGTSRRK